MSFAESVPAPAPLPAVAELAAAVAEASAVVPMGAGTHREVGGPVPEGVAVRAPSGVVAYDPAELTVSVLAGTTVAELNAVLAAAGQECPLDPRDESATVGGVIAAGLSGHRRLRYGPLRDLVLEVRLVMADGAFVRGGAPVVKNVTGYDLPRLIVGSFGTLAVVVQATLRCRPRPEVSAWATTDAPPEFVRQRVFAPSALLWDGTNTQYLLEGDASDVDAQLAAVGGSAGGSVSDPAPSRTEGSGVPFVAHTQQTAHQGLRALDGAHRGRISVRPAAIIDLGRALDAIEGCRWIAEGGVGTTHVATDTASALGAARDAAQSAGGWMLREAGGGEGFDGFGVELPDLAIARRLKQAFDPAGKLSPGRLPL